MQNDNLTSNKHFNILKASLPFVPSNMQRGFSYYIKIGEFNNMVQCFKEDNISGLQACGINAAPAGNSFNLKEYLTAISPYLSKSEQDLINMMSNVVQAFNMINLYKDIDPSILSSITSPFSNPAFFQNEEDVSSNSTMEETNNEDNTNFDSVNTQENTRFTDNLEALDNDSKTDNQGLNIEALKNMLSPSQKAMFDTYSSMLNNKTAI